MHELFADWFQTVNPNPNAEELDSRWKAVKAVTEKLSARGALDLVRVAHGLLDTNGDATKQLREAFKSTDPTFRMRDNDVELRVLASSAIAVFLEQNKSSNESDVLALAEIAVA